MASNSMLWIGMTELKPRATKQQLVDAMNKHILAEVELVGTYKHALQFQGGTGEVGFENFVEFPEWHPGQAGSSEERDRD